MSETSEQDEAARRIDRATKILSLLYALISLLVLAWFMIPEHQRRLMAMQVMEGIRRRAGTAAFRTGQQAMGLELSASVESYELPYRLSLTREWAAKAYDKLRYTA